MKFFVSILGLALLYTASGLPILEQSTGGSAPTVSSDLKTDAKSELSSTTLAAEKLTEGASKESSSPAPSSTSATEVRGASSPKEELLPQQPLKPSVPSPAVPAEEPAKGHHHVEPPKPVTDIKSAPLTAELAAKPDIKVEQVSSSEKPKELNNQVNAVSVDEPKPVQNEVKSEIPKETVKSELPKEEVKAEKLEEKKEEKREDHKPVPVVPVLGGHEAKPAEKPAEEIKKPAVSSEEKSDSREKDVSKEAEKKEPAKPDHSSESSEEKKSEKPVEGIKKEESSIRPQAEPLPTEASKPTSAQPASEKLPEKLESEKDVIKREAAKDKQDEKKTTDIKKAKPTPVKEALNKKPE